MRAGDSGPGSLARPHVAIVGGGIAGLAAAHFLRRAGGDRLRLTVFEGAATLGGKLQTSEVAGLPVDEGADAILVRRAEGRDLVNAVGLGEWLCATGSTAASVWTRGGLRPLPGGAAMGVPGDLAALARSRVLSPWGLARVPLELVLPRRPLRRDVSVGSFVAARLGSEVVERLVEPLLGGVYAGHAAMLSLDATLPQLAEAAHEGRPLLLAARDATRAAADRREPVFNTLADGLGSLPPAVARASGATVRTSTTVRGLTRTASGWRLLVGPARAPEEVHADAVVVAVPARPAARLLSDEVPAAAADLDAIEYASVAIVTLAYERAAFPAAPRGSGYLVPSADGRPVKAVTFSTSKWPHLARRNPDLVVVRCSIGRFGEETTLQRSDADLVATADAELRDTVGVRVAPVDSRVSRWGGALPQYTVGHLDRVARIRNAVGAVPRLAVCGAAYDGLGIPACVASARRAAASLLGHLDPERQWGHGEAEGPGTQRTDPLHDVVRLPDP